MHRAAPRTKLFLATILAAAIAFTPSAQTAIKGETDTAFLYDFVHRAYTSADGLPGMSITTMLQDKDGYLWIGTYDGLVRFDGVEFVTYSRYTDPKFDFASVQALIQDSQGNLWVGHNGEGLSLIRPDGDIVKYDTSDGLTDNKVNALCEDKEGNIWLGTSSGICYLTKAGEFVIPDGLSELGLENILVARLMCDSAGRIWVSTGREDILLLYSNRKFSIYNGITKIAHPSVRAMYQDKNGAFWFGVDPHYAVRIKENEETVYDIGHDGIAGTAINAITQDSSGNFWFSTDGGLTIMHAGFLTYYDKSNGAPDNGVNKMLEDREGNFWISYNRGGLEKLSAGKFQTVGTGISVNAICEDKARGITWIAADNGVYAYKGNSFVENELTELSKGARVRHVGITDDGEVLLSSYSAKIPLVRFMPDGSSTVWTEADGLNDIKCRVAIKTKNGDYYIGMTKGLNIISHEDGSVTTLTKKDGLRNDYIMWLYEDEHGQVWLGTNGGGVYILKDKAIIAHYGTDEGLAGNVIFKIGKIGNHIWIATGTGVSEFDEDTQSFVSFNSKMGLGTDSVFQLLVDSMNTAWMTTNKGIFSASFSDMLDVGEGRKKTVPVKYYGNSDGLVTNGVTSVSLGTIDSRGRVWFPLVDGFAIYDPVKSGKNTTAPKIEIQSYTVDSESFDYHGGAIVLPPGTKRFSIKYTGLSFISSENIRFKFMLRGFESDYSDWLAMRTITYTNLKHGKYEFLVKAQNSDGAEGSPYSVTVIKEPYLWELIGFWIAIGVFITLVIAVLIQHKVYNMHRYQSELERKVEERTHELKIANEKAEAASKAKGDFLSSMSHEIRTPINAVLGLDEMILRECGDTEIRGYASDIQSSGKSLLSIINDILDFSKIEAGKLEIIPVDYDASVMISDLVNMTGIKAEAKGLHFQVHVDKEMPHRLHGDEIRIKQCILNLLSNAVKYTPEGQVTLGIGFEKCDEGHILLKAQVSDTGIGIKPEDLKKLYSPFERIEEKRNRAIEGTGLGMSIVKNLLSAMGTQLEVKSEYGKGSEFSFSVAQGVTDWEPIGDYEKTKAKLTENNSSYEEAFQAPDARILVVDDTPINITVIKGLLKQTRITVDTAENGISGLEKARSQRYDLIFIDHLMPAMDGIEMMGELRKDAGFGTPCIALTANAISGAKEQYLSAGFTDYLSKPIDSTKLEAVLQRLLPPGKILHTGDSGFVTQQAGGWDGRERRTHKEADPVFFAVFGLDSAAALKNCGSVEIVRDAIRDFHGVIEEKSAQIERYAAADNWKDYTVLVHALKSSARLVGATELSELAKELEAAGNAAQGGDADAVLDIAQKTPQLLAEYRAYSAKLAPLCEHAAAAAGGYAKPEISAEKLAEAYAALREVVDAFDFDAADTIISGLEGYAIPATEAARFGMIQSALRAVDQAALLALL